MIHLFNSTYIEYDKLYSSQYSYDICSTVAKEHPISEILGESFDGVSVFKDLLEKEHEGSLENFWLSLLAKPADVKYVLYCDVDLYFDLTIQFWKSLFVNNSAEFIYKIYVTYMQDNKLKDLLSVDRALNKEKYFHTDMVICDFASFQQRYDQIAVIECLKNMPKQNVSFEFLMAEYLANPETIYKGVFADRLQKLCWRTWYSDLLSLRNELAANYLFLHKQFSVSTYRDSVDFLSEIKNCAELSWMIDRNLSPDNSIYICKNYTAEIFCKAYTKLHLLLGYSEIELASNARWNSFVNLTRAVFSGKYLDLFEANVEQQTACLFLQDHLKNESNQVLASLLYQNAKNKRYESLQKFILN